MPACPRLPTLTDTHFETCTMWFHVTRLDEVIILVVCDAVALRRDWRDSTCRDRRYEKSGVEWEITARVMSLTMAGAV